MAGQIAALRNETIMQFAALRKETSGLRFDLLKWAFIFWVGQVSRRQASSA